MTMPYFEFLTYDGWLGLRVWRGEHTRTWHIEIGFWQIRVGGDPWGGK